MRKIVLYFFTYIAILYITDTLVKGFEFQNIGSLFTLAFILSVFNIVLKPIIQFLTLPFNFFTFGLFNFVISCAFFYLFDLLIGGFRISSGSIGPLLTNTVQTSEIKLSSLGIFIFSSLFIAFLNGIVAWTQKD